MNLRTLLIIAGLALPIVAFAILSQSAPMSPKTGKPKAAPMLEEAAKKEGQNTAAEAASAPANTQEANNEIPPSPNAGQVPEDVEPGAMSAPPVVLPPIGEATGTAPAADASGTPTPGQQIAGGMSLAEAIEKTKERLGYLEKMHPSEWAEERKRHKNAPPTLNQAKEYNRNRLAKLATMTNEQWEKEKIAAAERTRRQWQQLTPQQQMEYHSRNQAGMLPSTSPGIPAPEGAAAPQPAPAQ
jgi:hypothetical protein